MNALFPVGIHGRSGRRCTWRCQARRSPWPPLGRTCILIGLGVVGSALAQRQPITRHSAASPDLKTSGRIPVIREPVLFNTPEADEIVSRLQIFPPDNPWNEDISDRPVHPRSAEILATMEPDRSLGYNLDMGYVIVPPDQKKIPIPVVYETESDPGPYPIPDNAPIEGWPIYYKGKTLDEVQRAGRGDRHVIVLDPYAMKLYELFCAYKIDLPTLNGGRQTGWRATQASVFDLTSNKTRPDGWTSADAAGLPIFPAVVKYCDVQKGIVPHAMRFTVRRTRRAYVWPATHYASRYTDETLPRMGERFRLRRDFDTSAFSPHPRAILEGLKKYGMFVADNGMNWLISIAPDERFQNLDELRRVKGRDFEVIVPTGPNEGPRAKQHPAAAR